MKNQEVQPINSGPQGVTQTPSVGSSQNGNAASNRVRKSVALGLVLVLVGVLVTLLSSSKEAALEVGAALFSSNRTSGVRSAAGAPLQVPQRFEDKAVNETI